VRALLPDALGSTIALGDGTGTLQTQYTYEPFGVTTQSGAASTSSYKFTGREDDGSGLMYYRARYYQPRLQRFIAEDPIGFYGGDANLYAYVFNAPTRFIDPSGRIAPLIAAGGVIGAAIGSTIYVLTAGDNFSLAGLAGAATGGAVSGSLGVIATPIAAAAGLGTGMAGTAAVNAVIGVTSALITATIDPCQKATPGYLLSSAAFGVLGGYAGQSLFPTVGMANFAQVGFPRTLSGVIPKVLGGTAGPNALNGIFLGGTTSGAISSAGPVYVQ
jgi:RHS repeat-associated protein